MEICYLDKGRHAYAVAGREYTMTGGDVLLVLPGDSHDGGMFPEERGLLYWLGLRLPAPKEQTFLNLRGAPARQLLDALRAVKSRLVAGTSALRRHLDAVIAVATATPPDLLAMSRITAHLLSFLIEVLDCVARQRNRTPGAWARNVIRLIDDNSKDAVAIERLARHMGLSLSRFKVRFRKEVGVPPADYLQWARIERAKRELLRASGQSITRIAFDLDFKSTQSFATTFKRYVGITPSDYRLYMHGTSPWGNK
jgi:AraC-like DNA-binding protein